MDKQRTLDDIFAAARADEPVMSRKESREVIVNANSRQRKPLFRWRMLFGIAALVVAAGIWLAWPHQQERTTADKTTTGNVVVPNSAVSSTGTEQDTANSGLVQSATGNASSPLRPFGPLRPLTAGRQAPAPPIPHNGTMAGVQMIELPIPMLDSLGIGVADAHVLYHLLSTGPDSALVLQFPNAPQPTRMMATANAPVRPSELLREHLRLRVVTDASGKWETQMTYASDRVNTHKLNDYSDIIVAQQLQDTTALSPREIQQLRQKIDSARKAREPYVEQLFDINRLIPIRINASDSSYYIFWYEPTPELLGLLPSPILARLRLETIASEMALYDTDQDTTHRMEDLRRLHATLDSLISLRIDNGESVPVPDNARPGMSIMETGRVTDGAISLYSISPNPSSGEFRVHFAVRERRVIEFSIYDINGGRMQAATSGVRMKDEDDEVVIRLKKTLPAGIYLLVLSSDRGERAVQRLVIEREDGGNVREVKEMLITEPRQSYPRAKTMEVVGVGTIKASSWLLDSLGIKAADSGRVYYEAFPIDADHALVFHIPDGDGITMVPMAEAPHITSRSARMKKWHRMITDDRGKQVSRQMHSDRVPVHDFSDALYSIQDTAELSPEEVTTILRRVDSLRSARGIVEYERLFDLNRLVPVRVDVPNHGALQTEWYQSSYYIFWYDPTPEFLAVMPDSTLVQIRSELAAATLALPDTGYVRRWNEGFVSTLRATVDSLLDLRRRDGHVVPSEIRPIPGAGFFTIGQTSSGALSITSLAPNPVNGAARLRYLLSEPREVEVALHDIHGTRLRVLSERVAQAASEHEQGIDFGDVAAGMYLLVVSTDRGERAVQRLVIER